MDAEGARPDFSEPWQKTDVVLVVEDEEFHVHKQILSLYSPFFRCLFEGNFREKRQKRIPLPGKAKKDILEFLNVLYLNSAVSEDNCEILLALADEYQAGQVRELCRKFLCNSMNDNNCLKYFRLACKYGLTDVRDKALPLAKNMNFLYSDIHYNPNGKDRVRVDPDYDLLEDKDKLCLLENRVLAFTDFKSHCSPCSDTFRAKVKKRANNTCVRSKKC